MLANEKTIEAAETDRELKLWQEIPKPEMPKFATSAEESAYLLGVIDGRLLEKRWNTKLDALRAEQAR